ncbi:hypothetical protein KUCAC02_017508 [Chaenocephalus aceratus]|uniref:Uncharacterized protein n=1 Tax=Chaenocephalus aceratus TaxID=36190 RepID=A0ACB9W2T7_CHAAC|nr:hypothetical protein KUCAC02_017508 [Chaenocephalus aceratus]
MKSLCRMLWISCMLIGYITCGPIQQETAAARLMHWPPPSSYRYWGRRARSDPGSSSYLPVVPVLRSNNAPELPALLEASSSAGPGNYRAPNFYRSPNMAVVKDDYASLRDEHYNSPVVREPEVAYAASRYDTSAPEDNVGSYYNLKDASWMDGRYNNPQVSEPEVAYAGNGYNSNVQVVDYGSSARPGLSSEPAGEEEPEPVFSEVAGPALLEASSSAGPGNYRAPNFYRSPNMAVVKDDYASLRDERYNSPVVREPEVAYAASRYDTSAPEDNVGSYYNFKDASWMDGRYNNPQVSEPEVAYAGNGYNSNVQVVDYGSLARPGLSSEPAGEQEPEPVFSEVAGLEPVSSFSSRSRYQRKRSQVAQTRYIPGEPVPWHAPNKYVF